MRILTHYEGTKDTKGSDLTPNFVLFVSFVVNPLFNPIQSCAVIPENFLPRAAR